MLELKERPDGWVLKVFVQPRSAANRIVGLHGDAMKIKLTAPPVDNAANQMCMAFLAKCLEIPKTRLEIVAGGSGRAKQILVRPDPGPDRPAQKAALARRLQALLNSAPGKKSA
jgi:hypothetical protein